MTVSKRFTVSGRLAISSTTRATSSGVIEPSKPELHFLVKSLFRAETLVVHVNRLREQKKTPQRFVDDFFWQQRRHAGEGEAERKMRQAMVVLAIAGAVLGAGSSFPAASQMLNDPPRDRPAARTIPGSSEKENVGAHPDRPAASGGSEIELPGAGVPPRSAGSPAGLPVTGITPFDSGGSEQQMGLYRALTK